MLPTWTGQPVNLLIPLLCFCHIIHSYSKSSSKSCGKYNEHDCFWIRMDALVPGMTGQKCGERHLPSADARKEPWQPGVPYVRQLVLRAGNFLWLASVSRKFLSTQLKGTYLPLHTTNVRGTICALLSDIHIIIHIYSTSLLHIST